jgi:hypothetical protein
MMQIDRRGIDEYVVSPMYSISDEHGLGLLLALLALGITWYVLRTRPVATRASVSLLAATGAGHLGLALGHDPEFRTGAFVGFGLWALYAARRWATNGTPLRGTVDGLVLSVLTYAAVLLSGEAPDQAGLIMKVLEIGAIGVILGERAATKTARLRQSAAVVSMIIALGLTGWIGAFVGGGHSHELGETPSPGLALPRLEPTPPSAEERSAADRLFEETLLNIGRFEDVSVAAAEGYDVDRMGRLGGHADNPAYKDDGRILDPTRPETLVYHPGPDGPVLLGAMYQTDESGEPGPMIGGSLTVWHGHDHVCFGLLPPGLGSLGSPMGTCPLGTITVALTNEMIHVWTVDGAPSRFGDLPDEWLEENIGS